MSQTVNRKDAINWIYLIYLLSLSTKCFVWIKESADRFVLFRNGLTFIDFILPKSEWWRLNENHRHKNSCIYALFTELTTAGNHFPKMNSLKQSNRYWNMDRSMWLNSIAKKREENSHFKVSNQHNGKYSYCELKRWFLTEANARAAGK